MRLNRTLMIKTLNVGQDGDQILDNCQSDFQFLFNEVHSHRMKKCADTEDAVYALISLQGQVELKNIPLESVGQYYANLVGSYVVHGVHR